MLIVGEGMHVWGLGIHQRLLYLPLSFSINVKVF